MGENWFLLGLLAASLLAFCAAVIDLVRDHGPMWSSQKAEQRERESLNNNERGGK